MTKSPFLVACAFALAPTSFADLSYPGFFSASGLAHNGNATVFGNRLRLTSTGSSQRGSTWATTRQSVAEPWVAEFVIEMDGTADGMAFVIQNDSTSALGSDGGGLGYDGIANSLAIEFDTYANGNDPTSNHVSVQTVSTFPNSSDHAISLGSSSLLVDLNDGNLHTVRVEYAEGSLRVYVDDTIPTLQVDVDLGANLALTGGEAYVGFTAATGGLTQAHYVHSWSFDEDAQPATSNGAPDVPTIVTPNAGGGPINPAGFTIELSPFQDPNGDGHACTEYEIWSAVGPERVWRAACPGGTGSTSTTLADGVFEGSLAGQIALETSSQYTIRARVQDDSGDALTQWSPWGDTEVQTSSIAGASPLLVADVQVLPVPRLVYAASGREAELPAGTTPARVVFESGAGQPLFTLTGRAAQGNALSDAPALPGSEPVRVRVEAGGAALAMNELDVVLFHDACERLRVTLPAVSLAAGATELFWIDENGGAWDATAGTTTPAFVNLERQATTGWDIRDGFEVRTVASGLWMPTNLAFVPNPGTAPGDPFLYVVELYGAIKVVTNDGTVSTYADSLLNYPPLGQFPGAGEQGLGSLVIDPLNGDIYLSLLYDAGGPHYPRVERFTSLDGGLTSATRTTILDMPGETQGQAHYIAHMELRSDRTLLVHMGDGFNASTARNLDSFRGKILRTNLDGTPPTDNPFYTPGGGDTARDYVWSYGIRNAWGGRTRASDGAHYMVENGPGTDRFARIVEGRDYQWDGQDSDMLAFALHAWNPAVGPVNLAWIETATFGGSGYPAAYMDRGYVSEAGPTYQHGQAARGKKISEYVVDATGALVSGPTDLIRYVGPGRSTCIGLAAGHDGLYFTDLYAELGSNPIAVGGRILCVEYVGEAPFVCGELGTRYCDPAALNSSGLPATLGATGSPVVGDADVTLEARQLPPNTFALPLASLTQGNVPGAGGSAGTLCLGGTIGRFNALISNSGATGGFDVALPIGAFPQPLSQVTAGETWSFQIWFRDFQLVQTSNYTNGLAITFE